MRFSEKRSIAWGVLVLCVLLSISLSGGKAMRDMRTEAEQIFYDGAQKSGLSISRDLDMRADKAYELASIASKYLGDDVLQPVRDASEALRSSKDIGLRHQANVQLTRAVEDLYTALEGASLSEVDSTNTYSAYKEIKSRADTISRDIYNTEAHSFNGSIAQFPASVIAKLTGVDALQLFE